MKQFFARSRRFLKKGGWDSVRRIAVAVIGGAVLLVGIALLVLPGPAFIVIPIGLAILASEFDWAKRWLKRIRAKLPHRRKASAASHR